MLCSIVGRSACPIASINVCSCWASGTSGPESLQQLSCQNSVMGHHLKNRPPAHLRAGHCAGIPACHLRLKASQIHDRAPNLWRTCFGAFACLQPQTDLLIIAKPGKCVSAVSPLSLKRTKAILLIVQMMVQMSTPDITAEHDPAGCCRARLLHEESLIPPSNMLMLSGNHHTAICIMPG